MHFSILRTAIEAHGGRVVKTLGDGVMATFASAVQALGCAVAIQEGVDGHNRRHPEKRLSVRVGVHVGEPIEAEDDFHGTAVVVASRLCDAASGGQILASRLVQGLVGSRGGFRLRSAGRLRLKGLPEPVAAVFVEWQLRPSRPRSPSPDTTSTSGNAAPPRGPELVDRDGELASLQGELARTADGFRCVLMIGEAGVGKTRLAAAFLARHRTEALVLTARAYPLGATASLGLWVEALERHLRSLPVEDARDLCGSYADDLSILFGSLGGLGVSPREREPSRIRLLEGLALLLENLAADRPIILLFDDIHLADASSWEGLQYLARNAGAAHVLVVAAARPVELSAHEVASQVLFGLDQEGLVGRLDLDPLGDEELGELAETLVDGAAPPALVQWLAARSRGNPLFAVELVRALLQEGADLAEPRLRELPEGLTERVAAQLKLLDAPTRSLLELLAVLGRKVEFVQLASVSGEAMDELETVLESLVRSRLVVEEEHGAELTYEIPHPLIQETIYRNIGALRRRRLHREVARALFGFDRLGEAASHFARSAHVGDSEAITALRDALHQADKREAYREALTILGALVEVIPSGDERWAEVADAMSWEAEWAVDHRAGGYAATGIRAMGEMDVVLRGSSDALQRAAVKLRLASFLAWGAGDLGQAEAMCAGAVELFADAGDQRRSMLAANELAWIQCFRGDWAAWEAGNRSILAVAEKAGDQFVLMQALGALGYGASFQGRFEQAEAAFRRGIDLARQEGRLYRLTWNLSALAFALAYEGRVAEALPLFREGRAVDPSYRETPLPEWETIVHWLAGNFPAALVSAGEAAAWNPGGWSARPALGIAMAALSAVETGDTQRARTFLSRGGRPEADSRDWLFFPDYYTYAGGLLGWRDGTGVDSLTVLDGVAARILEMEAWPFAAFVLLDVAELAAESKDVSRLSDAAGHLEAIAGRVDRNLYRGLAAVGAAWSQLASGQPGRAAEAARQATELLAGTGCQAFLGRALHVLGRSLSTHDRAGASEALGQAAAIFEAGGASWRRDQMLGLLGELGNRGHRAAAELLGPRSLSPREREVARLAARGHTAREIAALLFIAERTVETHLARAYSKLGVRSKLDLTRRASELDL